MTAISTSAAPTRRAGSRLRFLRSGRMSATCARRDLEGFDAVIHLAALSNDPLGNLDPELTYEINHRASVRFAKGGQGCGCLAVPARFLVQQLRAGGRRHHG